MTTNIRANDNEYLNYKLHMSVHELQTSVALLKENYEMHSWGFTLQQLRQLLNLLIEKDASNKEEYMNDLAEVTFEENHTVFNNAHFFSAKIHTNSLNSTVEDYVDHCIPSSNYNILDRYEFNSYDNTHPCIPYRKNLN